MQNWAAFQPAACDCFQRFPGVYLCRTAPLSYLDVRRFPVLGRQYDHLS